MAQVADPTTPEEIDVSFDRAPDTYRHWRLEIDGSLATVTMVVDPAGGLRPDYELKLNSYDLGVDIELYDIVQRLRFEHPEVKAVVLTGGLDRVFCAGANIQMLAGVSHHHKVNFCKFTNETRTCIEDATATSRQVWLCAVNGTAAGGGYELALACDEIVMVDDRASTVSLPEVSLLGVLPGTGGLTRLVDKRRVRRDLADVFATRAEGYRAQQALAWHLVDSIAPRSGFAEHVAGRASARAASSDRPGGRGVTLIPLEGWVTSDGFRYQHVEVALRPELGAAELVVHVPVGGQPTTPDQLLASGADAWVIAACRELEDAILRLRFNEPELGTWVLRTAGDPAYVLGVDDMLRAHPANWLVRETTAFWKRTLRRLDASARTLLALIEPGSCFAGTLAELALAADRTFMLDGTFEESNLPEPRLTLTDMNDGAYPMANGLSRLESRFAGHHEALATARRVVGKQLDAGACSKLGLVTFALDDLDWDDEVRLTLEERASYSPDALSGLEANLRFAGPETCETKIFGRLSARQNWIFSRSNASGAEGALRSYGTGSRPSYDRKRV